MKYVIFIGDGMADNPVEALGDKTPLEVADIPVIEELAKKSELGSVLTVPKGVQPGSDTAILSIFGYNPKQHYSGRSPLEAAGSGIKLNAGDVSYRCNMVALSGDMPFESKRILSHSGGAIDGQDAITLMNALLADEEFTALSKHNSIKFYPQPSFRHIAVQSGANTARLYLAPPHEHLDEPQGAFLPAGCDVANGLAQMMKRANEVLDKHPINVSRCTNGLLPANGIWFWAEGTASPLPNFYEKYGKKGVVISAVPLVRGIGALGGMQYIAVEGATGELHTNYEGKAQAVVDALKTGYDLAVLHIEAPDECTHNGDTKGKIQAIEWLSSRVMPLLISGMGETGEAWRMLFLSDHKTLTSTRGHDGDVVPYMLYDSRENQKGSGLAYTEKNGLLGPQIMQGYTLIEKLFA